jgi:uncharacterized protein involved in response to NO
MHARLMIEGFMGAFILGFLGTAGPRLLSAPGFSKSELFTLLSLWVLTVATHIAERYLWGDVLFLALLFTFLLLLGRRFQKREDLPPPSFVLVGLGFLSALAGAMMLVAAGFGADARLMLLGSSLLYQGFVLYLLLGVGGFLLPRLLQLPRPEFPESRRPTLEWSRRAAALSAAGAIILASFVLEVFGGWQKSAGGLRFSVVAVLVLWQVPFHRSPARVTLARCLKASLLLLLIGFAFPIFWPAQRVAGLHVVFVGGFTLLTFAVATRVVLGHSGQSDRFSAKLPFLVGTALLLVAAAVLRVWGDFALAARGSMLSQASYLWIVAAALWSWGVLPGVRVPDSDPD